MKSHVDWQLVAENQARRIRALERAIQVKDMRIAQLENDMRPTSPPPFASGEYERVDPESFPKKAKVLG